MRELRNIVIRLTTKCAGQTVTAEQLQTELDMESLDLDPSVPAIQDFGSMLESARRQLQTQASFDLDDVLKQWERGYVEAALSITQGNLTRAAKLLGVQRTTLYSRIQNYSPDSGDAKAPPSRSGERQA